MTDTALADTAELEIRIKLPSDVLEGHDLDELREIAAEAAVKALTGAIR